MKTRYGEVIPCTKCGANWLDEPSPMVHNHVWAAIGMKPNELLCFDCLYRALYRDCIFTDGAFRQANMSHEQPKKQSV